MKSTAVDQSLFAMTTDSVKTAEHQMCQSYLAKHHDIKPDPKGFVQSPVLDAILCVVPCKPGNIVSAQINLALLNTDLSLTTLHYVCGTCLKFSPGYRVLLLSFSSNRRNEYLGKHLWNNGFRSHSQLIWTPITPP